MVNQSKRVRILGKGHPFCYEKLLEEWFREDKFVDVILTCSNVGGVVGMGNRESVSANRR